MRFVEVGGVRVSAIGLGTWQFGSPEWGYGEAYAAVEAGTIVQRALDLGVNLIDTAEVYGFGRSERIVGQAISGRRSQALVATKVFPVLPVGPVVEQRGRASARRLAVECIDLYQLHWPNPAVPLGATMAGLRRLQGAGVVAHAGVSNYSLRRWRAAERALGAPVLSNQVRYSLVARRPERQLLPYAAAADRLVVAYSPLAQGLLSGRWSPSERPRNGVRRANPLFLTENLERATELLATLAAVARAHGATSAQVALAWVIRRPNTVAIPGARTVDQLEANVAAADLELSDDDDAALTAASDAFRPLPLPAAVVARRRRRARQPA